MIWVAVNVFSAAIVALIVLYKLGGYSDMFTLGERIGMGTIMAACVMRIGPIIGKNLLNDPSPFDDWSTTLLHFGLAIYFGARWWRVHRHWSRNEASKEQARRHFGGVGR
jgi:hypothetical protein